MKKIISLVLAVVMIMAMAIPAFAATADEAAPCATCNGNHTYEVASETEKYTHTEDDHTKTVTTYYMCTSCKHVTTSVESTTSYHTYDYSHTVNGVAYFKCTACGRYKTNQ